MAGTFRPLVRCPCVGPECTAGQTLVVPASGNQKFTEAGINWLLILLIIGGAVVLTSMEDRKDKKRKIKSKHGRRLKK